MQQHTLHNSVPTWYSTVLVSTGRCSKQLTALLYRKTQRFLWSTLLKILSRNISVQYSTCTQLKYSNMVLYWTLLNVSEHISTTKFFDQQQLVGLCYTDGSSAIIQYSIFVHRLSWATKVAVISGFNVPDICGTFSGTIVIPYNQYVWYD